MQLTLPPASAMSCAGNSARHHIRQETSGFQQAMLGLNAQWLTLLPTLPGKLLLLQVRWLILLYNIGHMFKCSWLQLHLTPVLQHFTEQWQTQPFELSTESSPKLFRTEWLNSLFFKVTGQFSHSPLIFTQVQWARNSTLTAALPNWACTAPSCQGGEQ